MGATLSLAYRGSLDPDYILYGLLSGSSDTRQVRLRSRRPFVPAARNLLNNLARLGIRASEWTNHKWIVEMFPGSVLLCPRPVPGLLGWAYPEQLGLSSTACGLVLGIPFVHAQMGLAPLPNCECGVSEQTADHVLIACPIHRAPHGAQDLTVLDDKTRCWLNNTTASI